MGLPDQASTATAAEGNPQPFGAHTPGQHLHAIMVAFFSGGGWAEAPEWDDFDQASRAAWEAYAETIGRNIRAANAAPKLLRACKMALAYGLFTGAEAHDAREALLEAVAAAEARE